MSDGVEVAKMMRPHDLCSAAYYGDVEKLKELLAVEAVEEEPPLEAEFDPLAPIDEEAVAAAADRAARREANEKEIQKRLSTTRRIVTRLSAVNTQEYGFFLSATELLTPDGDFQLRSRYKASRRSTIAAAPLHWAVLGREHAAVEFLVMNGADAEQIIPELGISVRDIIATNELLETDKVLRKTLQLFHDKKETERAAAEARAATLAERERLRQQAHDDIKRKEEEERLEAESAAAAEAAGVAAEPAEGE